MHEDRIIRAEQIQKEHYDNIAAAYEAHYDDRCSQEYRNRFIHHPMFEGISLSGMNVLEAMCGTGATTQYLLAQGARVTGLDISSETIRSFLNRWPSCQGICSSLLDSGLESESFDCVAVVGGLHHLHPDLEAAIHEIHRVLKPGGHFCFAEPHQDSIPDLIRQYWYKHDSLFAVNEAAIDLEALMSTFNSQFYFKREVYRGNIAYLFVLNSMVMRIPLRLKPFYTPAFIKLESLIGRLQGKRLSCFAVCQWQKR